MVQRILIVDDEKILADNLTRFLGRQGYETESESTLAGALERLAGEVFDVVLTDLRLPDGDGQYLLEQGRALAADSVFLVMTGHASLETALESFHRGAHDYLVKPFPLAELAQKIANITRFRRLVRENRVLRDELQRCEEPQNFLVGNSAAVRRVVDLAKRVAPTTSTVLITGESGTGKDLVARALHSFSKRREEPFVPLNLAAVPPELVESQLFGHVKGAFTGAERAREGAFRTASGGTLFLDEIGELTLPVQAKLLRVLEDREVPPVGSDQPIHTDTRVIAATHRNLQDMVEKGQFRQDLLFRINVVDIHIPPLRERADDIPPTVEHLVAHFRKKLGRPLFTLDPEVIRIFMNYPWKGNVRELSNVIERAMLLCEGEQLHADDLPAEFHKRDTDFPRELSSAVERFKYQHIVSVLESVDYNRERAARTLGLSPATLYRQMDRLGLKGYRGRPH